MQKALLVIITIAGNLFSIFLTNQSRRASFSSILQFTPQIPLISRNSFLERRALVLQEGCRAESSFTRQKYGSFPGVKLVRVVDPILILCNFTFILFWSPGIIPARSPYMNGRCTIVCVYNLSVFAWCWSENVIFSDILESRYCYGYI